MNLTAKYTILIIDDRPDDLKIMANCLEEADFKIMAAQNGESGLDIAHRAQPDLILLDVLMPGIDGFETCRRLKAEASTQEIPVIFMTSLVETEHKITGFEVGGVDYITKPIHVDEVLARVKAHLSVRALQKQLEAQNTQLQQEIAERQRAEAALNQRLIALTEPLETSDISFIDLFNLENIQKIQDAFAEATHVASVITKPDGTPLTNPSNFCRLCMDIIRQTEKGRANCFYSDAIIGQQNPLGPIIQPCLSGGLWDAGASITVGGKHIANWLIGQVKNEAIDEEKMMRYAAEIGANPAEFRQALQQVPVMSTEQFHKVAQALFLLANELSLKAYQNIQQARFITQRKQAEAALRESEARLRALINNLPFEFWAMDSTLRYTMQNAASLKNYGNVVGKRIEDLGLPAAVAAGWVEEDQKVLQGEILHAEYEREVAGEKRVYENLVAPVVVADAVVGIVGVGIDVTEHKQAEQALKASKARLAGIISSINDLIFTFDQEGRFTFYGSSSQERLYLDEKLFIGKSHAEVMPPHITALFEPAFARNKEGVVAEYDYCLEVGGQTGWYAAKLSPLLVDGKFTGSVAVIRNITERKQVEEALQARTRELGERVKELNCLYGIANLMQTPGISLTGILQGTVALIPPAWQYPQITCAQIIIEGQISAKTKNFTVTPWRLTADITARGKPIGAVEVGYLEERPARDKGPFLPEERRLLNAIAERLGRIIEQLRAEVTLHETEAKWRSLAETAPATIATLDRQGTILFINRPLLAEGLPKLVIGSSIYQYLTPQEQERTRKILEGVFESGGVVRYETTILKSNGREICYENRIAPIKVGSQITAVTYMALDITMRKQTEEALRESESRYKHLLESVADYIYTVKIEQNQSSVTYHHVGCEAVTGYTSEEYEADPNLWFRMVYDEDRPAVSSLVSQLLAGETAAPLEHRLIHKDGSPRWVRNTTVPKYDEQGNLVAYVGLITDITAHKRAEEALRQAHDELKNRVNQRLQAEIAERRRAED